MIGRDALDEVDETFTVTLSNGANYAAAGSDLSATVTITDDDAAPTLSIADVTVTEGTGAGTTEAVLTITAAAVSGQAITVDYATADGTATTAGGDYTSASGTATIAAGDTTATLTVVVGRDAVNEADETFTVTLSNGGNYTVAGSDLSALVTIDDDDGAPSLSIADASVSEGGDLVFTVSLSPASGQDVSFTFNANSGGTATVGTDYTGVSDQVTTITAGQTTATFTVSSLQDTLDEADETFAAVISGAVNAAIGDGTAIGTITDDDATPTLSIADSSVAEGGDLVFTVSLSAVSGLEVTFTYNTSAGTATSGTDYTAIGNTVATIPAGSGEVTLTVSSLQDTLDENDETLNLNLLGPTNATIADAIGIGTITDDDASPSLSISDASATEGSNLVFTVSLSAVSGRAVTFDWATADSTATAGADYTAVSTTSVTIAAGVGETTLTVSSATDSLVEGDETFHVNLSNAAGAMIADNTGVGTITDDDAALTVVDVTSPETNGTYTVGAVLAITVEFSGTVTVTGSPRLLLETGATDRYATYASGTGSDTLTFSYTVQTGDVSSDLDYVATGSLDLNAGTIKDAATNDVTLTLPSPGAAGSLGANKALVIDGVAPTAPTNFDDGVLYYSSVASPLMTWTAGSDSESGLAQYELAIGTSSGGTQTLGWTAIGNVTSYQATGLTLTPGTTYYASLRAVDNVGNTSSAVNGDGWTALGGQKLTATGVTHSGRVMEGTWFARSSALSEDGQTLVIGAVRVGTDAQWTNHLAQAGAAYVYVYEGGSWRLQQKLVAQGINARVESDNFGWNVAISGETIVVGASGQEYDESGDNSITNAGAAYVFTRTAGVWSQQQKLVAQGTNARMNGDSFGTDVSISGETIVVGASGQDYDENGANSKSSAGAAYVFTRSGGVWSQQQKLVAQGTNARLAVDSFGGSVSISGETIVVGAHRHEWNATGASATIGAGAAYVFTRSGGVWSQQQKLVATGTNARVAGDAFGYSVAISGETIVIGAYTHDYDASGDSLISDAGAAYVFTRSGGVWSQAQKLVGTGTNGRVDGDLFGKSVAISGGTIAVTISGHDFDTSGGRFMNGSGAVQVFYAGDQPEPPQLSVAPASGFENGGAISFTVTMNKTWPRDITFKVNAESHGSALPGTDYTAISGGTYTILAGQLTTTVDVTPLNDGAVEGDESFLFWIHSPSEGNPGETSAVWGTIQDDD